MERLTPKAKRRARRYKSIEKEHAKYQFAKNYKGYNPKVGWVEHAYLDGIWQPVGNHLKKMHNSNLQKEIKRRTSRKVRRTGFDTKTKGNSYRRVVDYWWEMF